VKEIMDEEGLDTDESEREKGDLKANFQTKRYEGLLNWVRFSAKFTPA